MTAREAWQKIITELSTTPGDFKTVPRIKRDPVWFYAETNGDNIYVDNARQKRPSSRLAMPRKITFTDFETVNSYYSIWSAGEVGVRDEVRQLSRNTAYIFALIAYYDVST